ncbi:hypothetical protein RI129_003181 [Pyrocoelia pectoralis]|uniref:ISXO2-like transposase domain-containing protein n=1 Tax=Pyrocoelia pectoralis TaxID=417401 RepID=A0AAN7VR74_9COLE
MKRMIRISNHTFVDWACFCREVVLNAFIDKKEKLGGIGVTVEIDESKFGRRKYHRGHRVEGQWIFGGYERGSGRVFMVAVEDRGRATLLPIIKDWILPGTTVISDFWKAYDCLQDEGYEHLKVNHSLHFKDPVTGAHSNSIESSWCAAKTSFSSSGRIKAHIPGNLARYMFEKRCDQMGLDRAVEFLTLAGLLYRDSVEPVDEVLDDDVDFE